ncbi:MAG: MBL fold metallo-hydrolase [Bacteroidetes bacterium]|nr:MBL fold metallo-hydrolase [Bacteroidota bacterium]
MTITFLGTGTSTGVPVVACDCPVCKSTDLRDKRLRTSLLIKINGQTLVIDCGPDFRYQMIRNEVDNLDAILFTHEHRDHIAGLDDIRGFNYVLNKTIDLYAGDAVVKAIYSAFPYILNETRFFGAPQINFLPVTGEPFFIGEFEVIPIRVLHNKLEVFGYRIGDMTYITDASFISPEEKEKIAGSKILIINALRNSRHISHYCLNEALEVISEVRPEKAYITHMSHFIGLHAEVEKKLPHGVFLAYDNLTVEIR